MAPIRLGLMKRGLHDCSPSLLFPLAKPDTDEFPGVWQIYCTYSVFADAQRQKAVARRTLLCFGMPEAAGGDEMYEHDQQDRSDDRDDKLAHQPKLGEVVQAEIADDKVGDNCSDDANHQVAQNAEAPTTHGAAREASGDGARNNLQRQIAKGHCKCSEYHWTRSSFCQVPQWATPESIRIHSNSLESHHVAER